MFSKRIDYKCGLGTWLRERILRLTDMNGAGQAK